MYDTYVKWQAESNSLTKDKKEIEKSKNEVRAAAIKQYGQDSDALGRDRSALKSLKGHILKLIIKIPTCETECRDVWLGCSGGGCSSMCAKEYESHLQKGDENLEVSQVFLLVGMQEEQGTDNVWT